MGQPEEHRLAGVLIQLPQFITLHHVEESKDGICLSSQTLWNKCCRNATPAIQQRTAILQKLLIIAVLILILRSTAALLVITLAVALSA